MLLFKSPLTFNFITYQLVLINALIFINKLTFNIDQKYLNHSIKITSENLNYTYNLSLNFINSLNKMVYKVIALSGSLQKASTNTGLLRAVLELKNPDLEVEVIDITEFPHVNPDLIDKNGKFPDHVEQARQKVIKADAVLFAIPEYNFRVSAPLKNAYDWLSMSTNPANIPAPMK